jgi:hypothetical protein
MEIQLQGSFYDLMEFLYELRHLVDVREDAQGTAKLYATGRLFTVNNLDIEIAKIGDPNLPPLTATIKLDAFVYGTGDQSGSSGSPSTPTSTTSTSTTTTTSGSASAASAPAGGSQ